MCKVKDVNFYEEQITELKNPMSGEDVAKEIYVFCWLAKMKMKTVLLCFQLKKMSWIGLIPTNSYLNSVAYFVVDFSLTALNFQHLSPTVIFLHISWDDDLDGYNNKINNIILLSQ